MIELSRSTGGELSCCFFCHRITAELERAQALALELSLLLRRGNAPAHRVIEAAPAADLGFTSAPSAQQQEARAKAFANMAASPTMDKDEHNTALQIERRPVTNSAAVKPSGPSALTGGRGLHVKDIDGGFTLDPWSTRHFKRGTHQFRLLVMAHRALDVRLPRSHPLQDKVGRLSYRLGQVQCSLPFRLVQQGGEFAESPAVWIKQARMHYLCGTMADVRAFLRTKTLHVDVVLGDPGAAPRTDHSLSSALPRAADGQASLASEQYADEWAGAFDVPLSRVRLDNTAGYTEGSEKADYSLGTSLRGLGLCTFALSVAIIRDEMLPWQLEDVASFYREGGIFWPAPEYCDAAPLPGAWLAMLQVHTLSLTLTQTLILSLGPGSPCCRYFYSSLCLPA